MSNTDTTSDSSEELDNLVDALAPLELGEAMRARYKRHLKEVVDREQQRLVDELEALFPGIDMTAAPATQKVQDFIKAKRSNLTKKGE